MHTGAIHDQPTRPVHYICASVAPIGRSLERRTKSGSLSDAHWRVMGTSPPPLCNM